MKKIILIPLLLISIFSKAQSDSTSHKGRWSEYGLFTISVVSSALGDGFNSRAKYTPGHLLSAASYISLLAIPFVVKNPNWKLPATYLLIRYAWFDGLYNVGAHRKINYIGGKNYYDESVGRMPLAALDATKIGALGLSIVINLK